MSSECVHIVFSYMAFLNLIFRQIFLLYNNRIECKEKVKKIFPFHFATREVNCGIPDCPSFLWGCFLCKSVGWRARYPKQRLRRKVRANWERPPVLSSWTQFCRQQWAFLSREVSGSHTCFIRVTVGSGQGSVGEETRETRVKKYTLGVSSVQSLTRVHVLHAACQASLSITNSQSLLKPMSIELVMPSNHLILCPPLLLLPSVLPSIRVFSNESALHIRWPKYWCFSFGISPSNEYSGLISFRMDWLDLLAVQGTLKSLLQHHTSKHQFFGAQLSL